MCSPANDSTSAVNGSIYDSGGAGGNYGNNQTCSLLIQPPGTGQGISLTINLIDIRSNDHLRVYDGTSASGTLLYDYVNVNTVGPNSAPTNLTAQSGAMYLSWTSNSSTVGAGWSGNWQTGELEFSNVTTTAGGLNPFTQSAAWGDFDNDGDLDLYTDGDGDSALFVNQGNGSFNRTYPIAPFGGAAGRILAAWGDYNQDGNLDLHISGSGASAILLRNNGGVFVDKTSESGLTTTADAAAWADYDGDGDLDLYSARSNSTFVLFNNNGNGTFSDNTTSAGVGHSGVGASVSWGDYNSDGYLDLYVLDAQNANSNVLFRNNGNGTFTDIASGAGLTGNDADMGSAWGDYDGDGDLDIAVTYYNWVRLYKNNGNGTFSDDAPYAGVSGIFQAENKAPVWGDYDADGDLDLFVSSQTHPNVLYKNNGDGQFTKQPPHGGLLSDLIHSSASAWADYDIDGDLDLFVGGSGSRLFRNERPTPISNTYISLKVLGSSGEWTQSGVTVKLRKTADGSHIATRTVDGGSGKGSQNAVPIYFYNLNSTTSYDVQVFWTNGTNTTHTLGTPDGSSKRVCRGIGLC
jgi:hypothetical protein